MKTVACFIFSIFLLVLHCFSQDSAATNVFHISKLTPEGIVLDKGWKFTAGDNPAYASPDYDDSEWQAIDPTKDIHDIPALWENKIVWFRIHVSVDTALLGKLAMMIQQSGA